jgi:hypothetical protein
VTSVNVKFIQNFVKIRHLVQKVKVVTHRNLLSFLSKEMFSSVPSLVTILQLVYVCDVIMTRMTTHFPQKFHHIEAR